MGIIGIKEVDLQIEIDGSLVGASDFDVLHQISHYLCREFNIKSAPFAVIDQVTLIGKIAFKLRQLDGPRIRPSAMR